MTLWCSTANALQHSRCGEIGPPASPERLAMAGRLAHRVKNDDKITGETLSQIVPGNTLGKALQDIEISPKTKGYRHSS